MVEREGRHLRVPFQDRVHRPAQVAHALSVNDPDIQNASRLTRFQIIQHQIFDFTRIKRVQVQRSVDRELYRLLIHRLHTLVVITNGIPGQSGIPPKPGGASGIRCVAGSSQDGLALW